MVDVVLINPGDPVSTHQGLASKFVALEPPVFAGLYANFLRNHDVSVGIIDAPAEGLTPENVAKLVTELDPEMAVLVVYGAQPSASTQNMDSAVEIAGKISELSTCKIMMVGTHPAALPLDTLKNSCADFVCSREGPVTILKTYRAVMAGKTTFEDIPSLWWWDHFVGRVISPVFEEQLIFDLDKQLPGIAWDLLPMDKYRCHNWHAFGHLHQRSPYAAIHTSLGCPFKCSFCCINTPFGKSSYRLWSPNKVMEEIDHLARERGVFNLKFVDEMFVLNENHVMTLCRKLASREYKVNIWAYARVDTVSEKMLDALKLAGVNWLCLGIESASDHVRDGALKKYSNEDIIEVVHRIKRAGIHVIGNYIFGLPDDTLMRMQETYELARELNCEYANFYSAMAYPGSPLHKQVVGSGEKVLLPTFCRDYSQHSYGTKPLANKHLTAAQILEFRDRAHWQYFSDPSYLRMIRNTFGEAEVDHIAEMVSIPLKRKLLGGRSVA